jgi:protease I
MMIEMAKKAVMIIAFEMFRDEEYAEPKAILEKNGFQVTTASSKIGTATGRFGLKAKVDITLNQLKAEDYDAILFIGGPGSHGYYQDPLAHRIAQEAVKQGKLLGAICAAPGILANAGVLKGRKATVHEGDIDALKEGGAIYTGKGVETDGKIITATGPATAKAWGEALAKAIQ